MRKFIAYGAVALVAVASSVSAKEPCIPHKPGEAYPWTVDQLMSGDQWGDFSIDLDAKGKVTGCRAIKGNLKPEMGFWICRSLSAQGEFAPILKDGVAVAGLRTRQVVLQGMRHRDADAAARKRWFAAHPAERQSCYPG